jgi:hypothetical protein
VYHVGGSSTHRVTVRRTIPKSSTASSGGGGGKRARGVVAVADDFWDPMADYVDRFAPGTTVCAVLVWCGWVVDGEVATGEGSCTLFERALRSLVLLPFTNHHSNVIIVLLPCRRNHSEGCAPWISFGSPTSLVVSWLPPTTGQLPLTSLATAPPLPSKSYVDGSLYSVLEQFSAPSFSLTHAHTHTLSLSVPHPHSRSLSVPRPIPFALLQREV